jgi:WD40 repeat protein
VSGRHCRLIDGHTDVVSAVAVVRTSNRHHVSIVSKIPAKVREASDFVEYNPEMPLDGESVVIVSGSVDRSVRVSDYEKCQPIFVFRGHVDTITGVSGFVSSSTAELIIVSTSDDRALKMWSMRTGKCESTVTKHDNSIRCMSLFELKNDGTEVTEPGTSNFTIIATGGWDKSVRLICQTKIEASTETCGCLIS